ncbi:hypothetical protein B9G53_19725 [Pseudanabaena sp. SR411]|uniref:hypothetical protein n=1 Tax=Pseudanabaena sp. SR411 TaxID=1980935 RepID=UPI000B99C8C0|nr:hypothetical protein [Pseudanabaena sp. SR411]OYQ62878.1 hypothetical protein B9G53_19725 [Pseudanabaena sp. SR411]
MDYVKLDISYERTRTLVLKSLSTSYYGQVTSLYIHVARLAIREGIATDPFANSGYMNPQHELEQKYNEWIDDIVWDLIIEGIVRPGQGSGIYTLPHYHISEYGKRVLQELSPQPYDPDEYLARVSHIPDIDNVILIYLEESLKAFRINCLLSSVITLGCASEKAFLLLIDACREAMSEPGKTDFAKKIDKTISIKQKQIEFQDILQNKIIPKLPRGEVKENLEAYLFGIFNIIRSHRNDAGHPSGNIIQREHLYSLLVAFPSYLEKIYSLMDWLNKNSI